MATAKVAKPHRRETHRRQIQTFQRKGRPTKNCQTYVKKMCIRKLAQSIRKWLPTTETCLCYNSIALIHKEIPSWNEHRNTTLQTSHEMGRYSGGACTQRCTQVVINVLHQFVPRVSWERLCAVFCLERTHSPALLALPLVQVLRPAASSGSAPRRMFGSHLLQPE